MKWINKMRGRRWICRWVVYLRRIRSFRDWLFFIAFMCLTFYFGTHLFHFSFYPSIFNDNNNNNVFWRSGQLKDNGLLSTNYLTMFHIQKYAHRGRSLGSINRIDPSGPIGIDFRLSQNKMGYKSLFRRVENLLKEIENASIHSRTSIKSKSALIRGQKSLIAKDFPLYKWVLRKHGYSIEEPRTLRSNKKRLSFAQATPDWDILFCLDGDSSLCIDKRELLSLKSNQRVSRLPGVRNLLGRKDAFCSTMNEARKISILLKHPLTPLCFVFPQQYQQFIDVADALGYSAQWILKPVGVGGRLTGNGPQLVNIFSNEGKERLMGHSYKRAVIQQLVPNPLLVQGSPINLRLYVLITSIAPLRAFVHSEGLVYHRFDEAKNYKKIAGRTWLLSYFWKYLSHNAPKAMENVHKALVRLLLVTEAMLATQSNLKDETNNVIPDDWTAIRRCTSCFQLIAVDLMLNTSLDPWILEITSDANMQEASQEEEEKETHILAKVRKMILDDSINLISASTEVAPEVADALEEIIVENSVGVMGISCLISHDLCLSRDDLSYLLQARRESLNRGQFLNLYPAVGTENEKHLIDELSHKIIGNSVNNDVSFHKTADLHPLLMAMARYYHRQSVDDPTSSEDEERADERSNYSVDGHNGTHVNPVKNSVECSEDPQTLPYLSFIDISPKISLSPPFSPKITQYKAIANYDQLLITVYAGTQNCQSEARIDDKFGSARPINYTLGLGLNKITFVVVDISHTEPWVISSYVVNIHRLSLSANETDFNPSSSHQICSLKQDCDLKVFPEEACGLQREKSKNWKDHLLDRSQLPICGSGLEPGKWVLPCQSCEKRWTCHWREARWETDRCRYQEFSSSQLSECLSNKKLLFVGDSTNRGIMHYIIEKLNGTLSDNDKTHNIRIYEDLNKRRTLIGFTYYPKFWLPTSQRPPFDKTLLQLLDRIHTREKDSKTVIIFGGVQWLAIQHIHMLLKTITKLGLENVSLIMKTLGAGFHQAIEGIRSLTLEEQQKLSSHNMALALYAQRHNVEIVDTYNITVARYKDYFPGKCACHFHLVSESQRGAKASSGWSSHPSYHVEGLINAVYSEILISRICDRT